MLEMREERKRNLKRWERKQRKIGDLMVDHWSWEYKRPAGRVNLAKTLGVVSSARPRHGCRDVRSPWGSKLLLVEEHLA